MRSHIDIMESALKKLKRTIQSLEFVLYGFPFSWIIFSKCMNWVLWYMMWIEPYIFMIDDFNFGNSKINGKWIGMYIWYIFSRILRMSIWQRCDHINISIYLSRYLDFLDEPFGIISTFPPLQICKFRGLYVIYMNVVDRYKPKFLH